MNIQRIVNFGTIFTQANSRRLQKHLEERKVSIYLRHTPTAEFQSDVQQILQIR